MESLHHAAGRSAHPQVPVAHPDGTQELVDEQIAELMRALWQRGVLTVACTQDDGCGRVAIGFASVIEAQDFLDAVAAVDPEPDGLYNRIVAAQRDPAQEHRYWRFDVEPENWAVQEHLDEPTGVITRTAEGPPQIVFTMTVRFPPDDIAQVVQRLQRRGL